MLFLYNEIKWVNEIHTVHNPDQLVDFFTPNLTPFADLSNEDIAKVIFSTSVRAVKVVGKIGPLKHFNHIANTKITFYNEDSNRILFEMDLGLVIDDKPVILYLEYSKNHKSLVGKLSANKDIKIEKISLKAISLTPKARYHIKNQITRNPVRI